MAGHVDEREPPAVRAARAARSRGRSRSRARCSSGSRSVSLPVSARTSQVLPWSMWPAVPTVSGMRRDAPRRPRRPRRRSSVRQSSSSRPSRTIADDRRLAEAQRRRERLLDRAREARRARRAAARRRRRARRSPRPSPPTSRGEPLRARAHGRRAASREHAQHRDLAPRALRVEVERERRLERGERQLVGAQRALERVPAQALDEVGAADDDARLRAAEQLVAARSRRGRAPRGERCRARTARRSSGDERAGAEVVDERQPVRARDRARARASVGLLGEADDAEVRLVHAQEHARSPARSRARSRRRACGWSCRPRRAARRSARARRGCGSRRRSRPARRARRSPRGPRRARRARAAPRRRCC